MWMPLVTWSKSPGDSPLHQRRVWLLAQQRCLTIATVSQQLSGPGSLWSHHPSALRLPKILLKAGISSHFQNTTQWYSVVWSLFGKLHWFSKPFVAPSTQPRPSWREFNTWPGKENSQLYRFCLNTRVSSINLQNVLAVTWKGTFARKNNYEIWKSALLNLNTLQITCPETPAVING